MTVSILSRALPAAFVLACAATLPLAHAQSADPNTGGRPAETAPDPTADKRAPTPGVVDKAANSRAGKATKRVAKKGGNAVKRAGSATAGAVRSTGEKIEGKLPKGGGSSAPSNSGEAAPQR